MKKKVYIKPEICVLQLDIQAALATSSVQQASEEDYTEEKVNGLWDKNDKWKIWADYVSVYLFIKKSRRSREEAGGSCFDVWWLLVVSLISSRRSSA